ncbi:MULTISPECIES: hypothetical protein [unclassified Streptomyces]|uniref:hypothetical protein n=1 Tax=unclassified Streptomyces TaxID=2593676 RepID=UPI002E811EA0|nr:hypothetical protein [Streptomyces sp. NBC_00562]WTD39434.1 hypothetical protein OHB03_44005 [Streptomyces sp. NBC_01643]WUC25826.1 hypothetical protein OHA33_42265 [Streptomyces sp. NBC_00562]
MASSTAGLAEANEFKAREQQQRAAPNETERAERRGWARQEAAFAEWAARADPSRAALTRRSARLPGIDRAIEQTAAMFHTSVSVGWGAGDSRYASGVPLVNEVGTLLAVFDPLPRTGPCLAFLVDVGVPLLFPHAERQQPSSGTSNGQARCGRIDEDDGQGL